MIQFNPTALHEKGKKQTRKKKKMLFLNFNFRNLLEENSEKDFIKLLRGNQTGPWLDFLSTS